MTTTTTKKTPALARRHVTQARRLVLAWADALAAARAGAAALDALAEAFDDCAPQVQECLLGADGTDRAREDLAPLAWQALRLVEGVRLGEFIPTEALDLLGETRKDACRLFGQGGVGHYMEAVVRPRLQALGLAEQDGKAAG